MDGPDCFDRSGIDHHRLSNLHQDLGANGRVSYSNPSRQCLFEFEDCENRTFKVYDGHCPSFGSDNLNYPSFFLLPDLNAIAM